MDEAAAEALAWDLLWEHGIVAGFKFNNKRDAFGNMLIVGGIARELQLSRRLLPYMTEEQVRDTILHEIAHAITGTPYHDEEWRQACIEVGANPEISDSLPNERQMLEETSTWFLTCEQCGAEWFRDRLSPNKQYLCGKCHETILVLRNPYHLKNRSNTGKNQAK